MAGKEEPYAFSEEKKVTAYHEMGHALVASILPEADPVHRLQSFLVVAPVDIL